MKPADGLRAALGAASFGVGFWAGTHFPDLDIVLLGIGRHRHWAFHSALPTAALAWVGDQLIQHYRRAKPATPEGRPAAGARLVPETIRYGVAPFIAGFAAGQALHLAVDGIWQAGKDVVGWPLEWLLGRGRTLDRLFLVGNAAWSLHEAGRFLAFAATGEPDVRRLAGVVREGAAHVAAAARAGAARVAAVARASPPGMVRRWRPALANGPAAGASP